MINLVSIIGVFTIYAALCALAFRAMFRALTNYRLKVGEFYDVFYSSGATPGWINSKRKSMALAFLRLLFTAMISGMFLSLLFVYFYSIINA